MQPSHPHAGTAHLIAKPVGDVDEFGGTLRFETKALADHHRALKARSKSSRVTGAVAPEAAEADISSIASANAT